jgi:hypothetical protein
MPFRATAGRTSYVFSGLREFLAKASPILCVSNIRPDGLPVDQAAFRIAWLAAEALRRGPTGVALKDESDRIGEASGAGTIP